MHSNSRLSGIFEHREVEILEANIYELTAHIGTVNWHSSLRFEIRTSKRRNGMLEREILRKQSVVV